MTGAGIYAIYYKGGHPLYEPISASSNPIYVGQARSAGARKGSAAVDEFATPLWDRIAEHHESITQARDLNVADFEVRYLVAVEVFVSLAEQLMIKRERPVWNSVVDGFGNHDPGANRRKDSFRPPWDELHPGRWWAEPDKMPTASKISAAESARRIEAHFARDLAQLALEDEQLDLGSDLINE
ncbi:Eco29kI family restriction endonuclease [Embleya scabrispora]|uniref:Eco29kI family restriction endonuclease n=1 Tax=Embleya scabrispora TaxID=159449 RepID=UPI0003678989|nr:Eco29kI family restriction endonuclease [Embleya scabrispora]